ncbi:MAG: sigma-70 family RNA polymerase sigma factor [Deltaproteobacteria bacterium]|nr:sigma-70 family RNA polymerase sigma factor [Deltaproteobacteria bacterium]MBN2672054.1 sigma-70 family RNA polymerase sigma factor [Deltaproteobacteria bacterium]
MATPLRIVGNLYREDDSVQQFDIDELFRQYSGLVASLTYRILGNMQDTEDIVQEVFIDAQKGVCRLRDAAAVKSWLATVAVRKSKRYLTRRRLLRVVGLDAAAQYHEVADRSASPEQRSQLASIYRMLDRFSADKRIAWVLRNVEGESMNQITTVLKCSRATAHRWIAEVQGVIEEEFSDE